MTYNVISYEGTEPYIFISYAHRDTAQVLPVLEEMHRRGYRVWYDDGIAPGSEWPENIAQHLNGSALVIAFVSPNSIASDNCRREVTFALSKKKPFLGIVLEPTEMSLGMELQLSAQQCIMKYGCPTEENFYGKLFSCPYLEPCLAIREPELPAEEEVPDQKPEPVKRQPKPERKPTAPKMKREKPEKKPGGRGRLLWIAGAAVAALVLVCVLVVSLGNVRLTDNRKASVNETYLGLSSETVTVEMAQKLNRLGKLESITFTKCTFEPGALAALELPETMTALSLKECTGVDSLEFVNSLSGLLELNLSDSGVTDALLPALTLPQLEDLDLSGNSGFRDLTLVSGCSALEELNITGTGVTSLEAVSGMPLARIYFSDTAVSDVSPLAQISGLVTVEGANTGVKDIAPLAALESLSILDFTGCGIQTVDRPFVSLRLKQLLLGDNDLSDLSAFDSCTTLQRADLSGNPVSDLSVLAKSSQTLQMLDLSHTALTGNELGFLNGCIAMEELYLDGVPMENLDLLRHMADLTRLSAVGCGLTDIWGIAGCTQLTWLRLADNALTEVAALKDLAATVKVTVDLGYNPLKDVSGLPLVEYRVLSIISDELDVTTIPQITGNVVAMKYSDDILTSPLAEQPFLYYDLVDTPADKVVALEDTLGAYRLRLLEDTQSIVEQMETEGLDYGFLLETR